MILSRKNSPPKGQVEEDLSCTAQEGDGIFLEQEVLQHLGESDANVDCVHNGEMAEQDVHGCVKEWICGYEWNHDHIGCYSHQKDGEDHCKDKPWECRMCVEAQEDEVSGVLVKCCHVHVT